MTQETSSHGFSDLKLALSEALFTALASTPYQAITFDMLADSCGVDSLTARLAGGDKMTLILHKLALLDAGALAQTRADIAEDDAASMHEKLLEGAIHRFEVMAPYRAQIDNLHQAAMRDPALGVHLLGQLYQTMDALLMICGDTDTSWQRRFRVKGLVGIMLRLRPIWQADTSPDLAPTMKKLDSWLKEGADWAATFRLVPASASASTSASDDGVVGDNA